MKPNNGNLDPVVGFGFLVIVLAAFLCGTAALKYLIQGSQPVITDRTVETRNVCWFFCRQGGQS